MLHGRRLEIENINRHLHGLDERCAENQSDPPLQRQRHDFHLRRNNPGESPLAAANQMVEVPWLTGAAVQRITWAAFQQARRHAFLDFQGVKIDEVRHQFALLLKSVLIWSDFYDAAIVE